MKIGKNLRNLLLKQVETYTITKTKSDYLGEIYTYPSVTKKEVLNTIKKIQELLK